MSSDVKTSSADAAQPMLECTSEINKFADADLANIFEHLPPSDRLLITEVCKRWLGISRRDWLDIRHLDLSAIPGPNIGAIVKLCPNLVTVFGSGKSFSINELHSLCRRDLASLKLYDCSCVITDPESDSFDLLSSVFSQRFAGAVWTELVLCDLMTQVDRDHIEGFVSGTLPASLKRLQLSGVDIASIHSDDIHVGDVLLFLSDIWRLQNLTCLILTSVRLDPEVRCMVGNVLPNAFLFRALENLTKLRELCLGWDREHPCQPDDLSAVVGLPKLEVLILFNCQVVADDANLKKLSTEHPTLRILVIGGLFGGAYSVPPRHLHPNGFNAAPLPFLHVFLGKEASENMRFKKSAANTRKVHPITAPLHEFLAKEEIAPIFEGVWIAAQIKECAKNGAKMFDYSEFATSVYDQDDV